MPDADTPSDDARARSTRKSRAEQQAETRNNLLDAALEVFIERGFHGASIDAIAQLAGYTKGAVYANFANKDELFLAIIDRRINEGASSLETTDDLAHAGNLPDDEERRKIYKQFEARWAIMAFEMILYAVREKPELLGEMAKRYQHIDTATTKFLHDKAADPPEAIDYLAIGQSALGEGLMLRHLLEPERINHDVIEKVFDAVFDPPHREAWKSPDQ